MSDGRCLISWHGVPCRYKSERDECNPKGQQMDNKTRAEKIVGFIIDFDGDLIDVVLRDFIISQLDEVVREAYTQGFYEGQKGLFQRGFAAVREKAAGIAENYFGKGVNAFADTIAERIRKMEA